MCKECTEMFSQWAGPELLRPEIRVPRLGAVGVVLTSALEMDIPGEITHQTMRPVYLEETLTPLGYVYRHFGKWRGVGVLVDRAGNYQTQPYLHLSSAVEDLCEAWLLR